MDVFTVVALLGGLAAGLLVGWFAATSISRAHRRADDAHQGTAAAQARTDIAYARAEVAQAKADAAAARAELSDLGTRVAEARAEAADAQSEAAEISARVAKAEAERDAAREQARLLAADRDSMVNQFKVLSAETIERQGKAADAAAEARLKATEQLMAPVRQSLEVFNTRLTEVEKERVAMSTDLRAQVQTVQRTGETLRQETHALVTALRKPQIRGAWGETQLKRVAELAGMLDRCDFRLQRTSQTDDRTMRPDMTVDLAEGKHVFVDSKVPLSAFLDAAATEDERERADHLANYARNVRTHVEQLSSKQYWKALDSPEFVVLFLPSEAFFAAALDQIPDLYEYAAARDVVIATPTTLIGMLRAIAYGWKQAALAESAAEVFRLGRELHERLGALGEKVDKLGRAIRSSANAYNEAVATLEGTVLVKARRFRDLKVSERELASVRQVEEPVRQIQAPELVEDAVKVEPMIGRRRRRYATEMPEQDALVRVDPDLDELVEDQAGPVEQDRRATS